MIMAMNKHHCTFGGCPKSSEQPYTDGWSNLCAWGPGIPDGFYCKPHADALEAMLMDGTLAEIQKRQRPVDARLKDRSRPPRKRERAGAA